MGIFGYAQEEEKKGAVAIEADIPNTCRYDKVALWMEFTSACSIAIDVATRPGAVSHDGNILLSHARLYVFADCYDMLRLADMSIDKLGRELLKLNVTSEAVTDITELLRYAYDESTPERLRNYLALYAACKTEDLWTDTKFRELVATHGDLAVTILGVMIEGLTLVDTKELILEPFSIGHRSRDTAAEEGN